MRQVKILCGVLILLCAGLLLLTYLTAEGSGNGPVIGYPVIENTARLADSITYGAFAKGSGPELQYSQGSVTLKTFSKGRGRTKSALHSSQKANIQKKLPKSSDQQNQKPIAFSETREQIKTVPVSVLPAQTIDQECMVEKPWFEAKKFHDTYLVFYGKPIMVAPVNVGRSRGWKMKCIRGDTSEGINELQELVSPERFMVVFTTSRTYRHQLMRDLANSTNALVGTIMNAPKVTGTKRAQLTSFRSYFQSCNCSFEDTGIMPRSFILDDTEECIQFFRYIKKWPKSAWFLKPSHGQEAFGITVHTNLTYLYEEYATCTKKPDSIVQEYVTNPLLLEKRKFDIRAYILIAKTFPHYLVFYHEGYLKRSFKPFDLHDTSIDVHISNTRLQTTNEGYLEDDHLWGLQDLQNYLTQNQPEDDGKDAVANKIVPSIQKIGLVIANSGQFLTLTQSI